MLASGSSATFASRITGIALGFGGSVLATHFLGPANFGAYAWGFAWATLLQLIAVIGFDQLLVRELPRYTARAEWSLIRGLLTRAVIGVGCVATAVALLGMVVGWPIMGGESRLRIPLVLGLITTPFLSLATVRQAAMQGLGRVTVSRIPDDVIRPTMFIGVIYILHVYLGHRLSGTAALLAQLACAATACAIGAVWLLATLPATVRNSRPTYESRRWVIEALPMWWVGGAGVILAQADLIIVGAIGGTTRAGEYAVATRIAIGVSMIEYAINVAYGPVVTRLQALGRTDQLRTGALKVTCVGFIAAAPVAVAVAGIAPWILGIFGAGFDSATTALRWLCASYIVSAALGQNGVLLIMTGHAVETARGTTLAVGANVALNFALVPTWGVTGAAVAWFISVTIWNSFLSLRVYQVLGMNITLFGGAHLLGRRLGGKDSSPQSEV
jgi:O-antigen/teichoic acid export membrane protein